MRRILVLLTLMSGPALADTTVTVEVTGVGEDASQVHLSVFDSKKGWLKKPYIQEKLPTDGDTVVFELSLPPGDYAFHAFLDVDMNDKMKTNFIGIPKEPTAVSNEAKGRFGPPKYKDAKITIGEEPVTVPMKLIAID